MKLEIDKIKINNGRRALSQSGIDKLAESISEIGLLNPISIDENHRLIAGYHRLETAKKLGWTEIECTVCKLDGLQIELAEIDENFVRTGLTTTEQNDLLLRRKELYETLHPETKAGAAQLAGMNRAMGNAVEVNLTPTVKSFVEDTAEKFGVSPSTIKRQVQAAKNTTPEAKEILIQSGLNISKQDALKLSRLEPEEQKEAAEQLVSGEIKSVGAFRAEDPEEKFNQADDAAAELLDKIREKNMRLYEIIVERNARLYSRFTERAQETLGWIRGFAVAWNAFATLPLKDLNHTIHMIVDIYDALDEFLITLKNGIENADIKDIFF